MTVRFIKTEEYYNEAMARL